MFHLLLILWLVKYIYNSIPQTLHLREYIYKNFNPVFYFEYKMGPNLQSCSLQRIVKKLDVDYVHVQILRELFGLLEFSVISSLYGIDKYQFNAPIL